MVAIPKYVPSTTKALEAILWIARRRPGIDIYHVVKAGYFADKHHLATYGRPIAGDLYQAGPYGPLAQVMYGLLKHDPIEILALESNGELPFRVDPAFRVTASREPNARRLSRTDVEALAAGVDHVADKSFAEIYDETHADPAYVKASGLLMDYRDFIPEDDPARAGKMSVIEETAPYAVF